MLAAIWKASTGLDHQDLVLVGHLVDIVGRQRPTSRRTDARCDFKGAAHFINEDFLCYGHY
jgi:hypothetical protein